MYLIIILAKCIAMSFPSENIESLYRNPIKNVAKYLDEHYPESYIVYNLCAEKKYNSSINNYIKNIFIKLIQIIQLKIIMLLI